VDLETHPLPHHKVVMAHLQHRDRGIMAVPGQILLQPIAVVEVAVLGQQGQMEQALLVAMVALEQHHLFLGHL
jgi:hypothetical protein